MTLNDRYKADGIWTMESSRTTCVVPERPLMISGEEEWELNELACSVYGALARTIDTAQTTDSASAKLLRDTAGPFPEGMTMPPAVRVDVVRSEAGPKIVEIDPITAISLGETAALIAIWEEQGYLVPSGLTEAIAREVSASGGNVALDIPPSKYLYKAELTYLKQALARFGLNVDDVGEEAVRLSAFNDVPKIRRAINRDGWRSARNPLWGPLAGLASKDNIGKLLAADKIRLPSFLPIEYDEAMIRELDPKTPLVAKPPNGGESQEIQLVQAGNVSKLPNRVILQGLVVPRVDSFGIESSRGQDRWASRISIYAGRTGLLGAQVTARPYQPLFTNVHGQADAVQTTIAVKENTNEI